MKKLVTMLLLVAIVASCTAAFAADFVKFKNSAYIYKKAGSGKTTTIIKRTSVVEKVEEKGNWTKIKYDDKEGWVRTKYVDKATETEEKVVYAGGGANRSKEAGEEKDSTYKSAKTTGRVNFRDGAFLGSKVIKTLQKGTKVKLLGKTREDSRGVVFYKAKVSGKEGWVSEKYLDKFE